MVLLKNPREGIFWWPNRGRGDVSMSQNWQKWGFWLVGRGQSWRRNELDRAVIGADAGAQAS